MKMVDLVIFHSFLYVYQAGYPVSPMQVETLDAITSRTGTAVAMIRLKRMRHLKNMRSYYILYIYNIINMYTEKNM